jgi:hypothetical protein
MFVIDSKAQYENTVTGYEYHTYKPYPSCTFKNNDEIRISVSQQDIITAPFESTLHISGKITAKKAGDVDASISLVNNAVAHLFDDIRYEIGGIEVDHSKNPGITTTVKGLLSLNNVENATLKNACWLGAGKTLDGVKDFTFCVPLRLLLGFAEDYKKVLVNVKQELILLRSASDLDAIVSVDATSCSVEITNLYWRLPHVSFEDTFRLKLLRMVEKDTAIDIPFRSWELHEYPSLPKTTRQSWTVKTSSQLEKPRFVILAFQTDRKNSLTKDASCFDHCELMNVRLYLNSQYYPYDNIHGDNTIFYEMFSRFQKSYYYGKDTYPNIELDDFKKKTPLYVIDCSKQNDSIKSGPVDVRLEFEAKNNFPDKTTAYCLILHDSHLVYTLLTGTVKKSM